MYEVLHYPMVQRVLIRKVPPQTRDSLPALSRMNLNAVVSWVEEGNRWLATRRRCGCPVASAWCDASCLVPVGLHRAPATPFEKSGQVSYPTTSRNTRRKFIPRSLRSSSSLNPRSASLTVMLGQSVGWSKSGILC